MDLLSRLDAPYLNTRTHDIFRAASVNKSEDRVTLYVSYGVSLLRGDVLLPLPDGMPLRVKKAPEKPIRGSTLRVTPVECEKGEA